MKFTKSQCNPTFTLVYYVFKCSKHSKTHTSQFTYKIIYLFKCNKNKYRIYVKHTLIINETHYSTISFLPPNNKYLIN